MLISRRCDLAGLAGVVVGMVVGGPGCSPESIAVPPVVFRTLATPGTEGCQTPNTRAPLVDAPIPTGTQVRMSLVERGSGGARAFLCDATTQAGTDPLKLDLGDGDHTKLDYYVETFDEMGNRLASGALIAPEQDVARTGQVKVLLARNEAWSCPPDVMNSRRAFHSATRLPSGEVLLLGGLTAVPAYPSNEVFSFLADAEIYDPRTGEFSPVKPAQLRTARAFHQVSVLGVAGDEVHMLVYGGLTALSGQPALLGVANLQLRLMPGGGATAGGAERLVYNVATQTLTLANVEPSPTSAAFSGMAALATGLVSFGGVTFPPLGAFGLGNRAAFDPAINRVVALSGLPGQAVTASLVADGGVPMMNAPFFVGPSVTPLSSATALVIGTQRISAGMPAQSWVALRSLPSTVQASALAALATDVPTAFHTATLLGPDGQVPAKILVTGGFQQNATDHSTLQPPGAASAVRVYTVADPAQLSSAPTVAKIAVTAPAAQCTPTDGHYRPAGWEAATRTLSGNQVLITGGSPANGGTACDCEGEAANNLNKTLCASAQARLFDANTSTLQAVDSLPVARFGHQQTRLLDGTILVTGGLVRQQAARTDSTAEAEVYNPLRRSTATTDENDPLVPLLQAHAPSLTRMGSSEAQVCKRF